MTLLPADREDSHPHPNLVLSRDAGVVQVRICREEALGALARSIIVCLAAIVGELADEPSVHVVILTGTGKGFVAGADINEYHGATQAEFEEYQRLSRDVFDRLEALPQITIAAVNGYALGGGFELALCCDLVLAAAKAKFGLPELGLGLLPGGGGTQRLARAAGSRFAKDLVLTGRFVAAAELEQRGLVTALHDPDTLLPAAWELARTIADKAPLARLAAKRLIDDGLEMAATVARTVEQQVLARLYASDDGKEGVAAFIEKRQPNFHGQR